MKTIKIAKIVHLKERILKAYKYGVAKSNSIKNTSNKSFKYFFKLILNSLTFEAKTKNILKIE